MKWNKNRKYANKNERKGRKHKKENTIVIVYDEFTFLHMLSANNCANYSEFKTM